MLTGAPTSSSSDGNGFDRIAILEQLERILACPLFRNSKRYPILLRYAVEHALDGKGELLKERALGTQVFLRPPDYDTNLDPVVRTTAVEIRKRLAQYYGLPGHEQEIRIELPIGSYVPQFRMPESQPAIEEKLFQPTRARPFIWTVVASIAVVAVAATGAWWISARFATTPLERFWTPVWESSGPVLLCIGSDSSERPPASVESIEDLMLEERIAFADAIALSRITGLMTARGKPTLVRRSQEVKFDDLRRWPTVLIGGFNNSWTLRTAAEFRYKFVKEDNSLSIVDQQNPGLRDWTVRKDTPYRNVSTDYAIVARVFNKTAGHFVVIAAGVSKYGTEAAGEVLSDPQYLAQVSRNAPSDWYRKNIEIVVATTTVRESSGAPRILAAYFW